MIENRIRKSTGDVTDAAILRGRNVVGTLWRGRWCCSVVARCAVTDDTGVIKGGAGKVRGVVTDAAIFTCDNMGRRHSPRTGFFMRPIMTVGAIAGDARVIKNRWRENRVGVADVTILFRRHMVYGGVFRRGEPAVVTAFTAGGDILVKRIEKDCRRKTGGGIVADTAIIQCRNMVNLFAGRGHLVMAEGTVADNARMVKHRLHKGGRTCVAKRTVLGGQQVVSRHACADQTVVTRCAVINDARMVKHAGGKGAWGMTNTTILCGWHVVDGLAARANDALIIVTGCAGLYVEVDAGVVENALKCKSQGVMTPTAIGGRDGMV